MLVRTCRDCGCTDERACLDVETGERCSWFDEDLCSFCAERLWLFIQLAYALYYQRCEENDGIVVDPHRFAA